jgi:iron(III) transport system permease protein
LEIIKNYFIVENKRWIIVSLLIAFFLLLPIVILFIKLFSDPGKNFFYLWNTVLIDYTFNTFYLILITSLFTLLFGLFPAWIISNYRFIGRNFYDLVLFLPLAIPSYIMGFTYIDILSFTGPIQSFLRNNFPWLASYFNIDYLQIETLGVLLGLALYPYVYTAARVAFSLLGSNYIDLSKSLGLSTIKSFYKIILPLSRPAIFSGLFLVFMEVLNEYGAVKYFGINTYTTGIFKAWFSLGDIGTAIQLSCLLLLVVFFFFVLEKISSSKTNFFYETNSPVQKLLYVNKDKLFLFHLVCSIPFILGFFIPLIFIVNNVFQTYSSIDFVRLFTLSFNTIFVSSLSSFIIIIVALFFLFIEKISKTKINTIISHLISLGYAIPGAVIGLGLIMLFSNIIDSFFSVSLIGSFYVLIYAYVIRFLAVGKSPIKSSLEKHPESYDDTGKNLGLGPFKLLQKIHLPINKFALISAFILTFIDIMKELPITLILRPFNFDTLATQTYEFAIEEMLPLSSAYSLSIIIIGSMLLLFLKNVINKQLNVS